MALGVMGYLLTFTAIAQSDPSGERRVTGTYAITNATVYTSPNSASRTTVIIKDGLIEGVGQNIPVPVDAQEIKGDSLFVYAGFIDVAGDAGVGMPTVPEKPADFDPSNPPPSLAGITPYHQVFDQFNPASEDINSWRKSGITMVQLLPKGEGMLPGKTAVVLNGYNTSSNILASSHGLLMKFEAVRGLYPGTVLGVMAKWRELYQNAELAMKHQALFTNNSGIPRPEKDPVLEAFFPVIEQKTPVLFQASDELAIRRALNLQQEKGFKMVLTGIKEGNYLIPMIKESKSQVVLSLDLPKDKASKKEIKEGNEETQSRLKRVKDAYTEALEQASVLEREGIPFAFGTQGIKSENFLKNIRLMIDNGLSEEAALAALTINAATILGLEHLSGSIEKGKLANLVLTTDSLFKKQTKVKHVMVDGYLFDYETSVKKEDTKGDSDIAGEWEYTSTTPTGSSAGTMSIKKEEGDYSGTITFDDPDGGGMKSADMLSIKQSGRSLEFQFNVNVQGTFLSVSVSGEITEDEYEGKMSITDYGSFPFSATKSPDSTFNN